MKRQLDDQSNVVHFSDAVADGKADLLAEPESVLGHRLLPTYAGVLRSGIKVPYESGRNALTPKERALYEKRISEGRSPREIEKEIKKELRPTNVPYFSVYRSECKNNPEHADLIRALYGNERGEIHRLRITLISDKWWESIPHQLMAFRKSGLYCSSEPIGGRLIATRDPDMDRVGEKQDKKEKTRREFKRKKITLACIPDECPIYMASDCRFSSVLHFMILGVPGTDVWRLPTNSWYSVRGIMQKIDMFQSALAAKGRSIVGIPFELFKYEAEISRWDTEKGRVRTKQWIIRIDCPELPLADLIVQSAGFGLIRQPQALLPMTGTNGPESRGATGRSSDVQIAQGKGRPPEAAEAPGTTLPALPPDLPSEGKVTPDNTNADHEKGEREKPQNRQDGTLDVKEEAKAPPVSSGKEEKEKGSTEPAHYPVAETATGEEMTLEELRVAIQGEVPPIGSIPLETVWNYLRSVGKSHFKELSIEEARILHKHILKAKAEMTDAGKPAGGTPDAGSAQRAKVCSACQAGIPGEVEQYSLKRFRRALCRSCQGKEKGALPSQTTAQRKAPGQVPDALF
ncbi:hypothetical protein [Candidatus Manganitrophus noduliformans]|uniref:Uncharacterized protein n=1 Tax=Candidatus Manganitrophus noduliformans TaxID=2606439 RepID=A0A7X6DMY1_9BACT|nr:hypothetical protein [Candidatus Manganitrophus noduliformans]NKE70198.1 hypothetical protein [Candidatus Manganitrophus noduliformans]